MCGKSNVGELTQTSFIIMSNKGRLSASGLGAEHQEHQDKTYIKLQPTNLATLLVIVSLYIYLQPH